MTFRGLNDPQRPAVHYEALRGLTTETGDRIEGDLYRGQNGYIFKDAEGQEWWILFAGQSQGQILACSRRDEEAILDVRVLASDVGQEKAAEAFRQFPPGSYEDAASLAAQVQEG